MQEHYIQDFPMERGMLVSVIGGVLFLQEMRNRDPFQRAVPCWHPELAAVLAGTPRLQGTTVDPFQDAVPCFIMNNSNRWDGWGERSRWEPNYANDDERQDARRRNKQ